MCEILAPIFIVIYRYLVYPQKIYAIETDKGYIHIDFKGKWWFGGIGVGLAVFRTKKEADLFRRKIKRDRPDLVGWTKIREIRLVKKVEFKDVLEEKKCAK